MRWKGGRRSENVNDRRGELAGPAGAAIAPAALRLLPLLIRTKTGRIILAAGIVLWLGSTLLGEFNQVQGPAVTTESAGSRGGGADRQTEIVDFLSVILADTEDAWAQNFRDQGMAYQEPVLVLFTGRVASGCGFASAATGPFYCPADQKLYLDISFFDDMSRRLGAPGDFAAAYVVAHEVGHHVQNLLGISERVQRASAGRSRADANALSVRTELQADCLAGVWGRGAEMQRMLEEGDLEEALNAAAAIGDDRLQRGAGGAVVPDSFTHGTSEQRARWFRRGFERGDPSVCDTFEAASL